MGFGLLFGVMMTVAAAVDWSLFLPPNANIREAWGVLGLLTVLGASSCYGIWCAIRMAKRLPAFLQYHAPDEEKENGTEEQGTKRGPENTILSRQHEQSVPRRPVGLLFPPLIATIGVAFAFVQFGPHSWILALIWPTAIIGLGCCLGLTRRVGALAIERDDHHIIAGVVAFSITTGLLGNIEVAISVVTTRAIEFDTVPLTAYVAGIVVWFGYMDDVFRYSEHYEDGRRLLDGGYMLLFATVFGVLIPFTAGQYAAGLYALVVVAGLFGIAMVAVSWFRL